jgi:hypothetical protein
MTVKFDLLRTDDLLNLRIEGVNLKLDETQPDKPALVRENLKRPAYLIVTFPPQTIVEEAFYESTPTNPPPDEKNKPYNDTPSGDQFEVPVEARIGRPSRLVFRFPTKSNVRIPYDIEGLLNWDPLELNVSPLADIPPNPTSDQRKNAPEIKKPSRLETAIEIPYRLILSPNHDVAWLHSAKAKTHRGVTELWHTRMALKGKGLKGSTRIIELSRNDRAPLRAIWSPDYNPDKFTNEPPLFGVADIDWGVLTAMTPSDRHDIVVLTSAFQGYTADRLVLTPYVPEPTWAEQFILSPLGGWLKSRGLWDPPAPFRPLFTPREIHEKKWKLYLRKLEEVRRLVGDLDPIASPADPTGLPINLHSDESIEDTETLETASSEAMKLMKVETDLSAVLWPMVLGTWGDLLNLSEWTHIATQGRDHYVRIVYEGHLYPFGHRAALIKITERKIRDKFVVDDSSPATPVAYMVQRMFIVVRQPLKDYTEPQIVSELNYAGRELPFRNVRLTTLVTPDIANPMDGSWIAPPPDPPYPPPPPDDPATFTDYSFWVRLGKGDKPEDDFKFDAVAEDLDGNRVDFTASLIFVPFSESDSQRELVAEAYTNSGEERACIVPAQKVTYAPPVSVDAGVSNENTKLPTTAMYFMTQLFPVQKELGGFLPQLLKATVTLPAVEALLGRPAQIQIGYAEKYLSNASGNTTGLFAKIVEESSPGNLDEVKLLSEFTADKAGGFATPNLSISGLTSKLGPLAGDLDKVAGGDFDPGDFFQGVQAELFGTLSLVEVLASGAMDASAPKVQFERTDLASPPGSEKYKLVAKLDWTPGVETTKVGIVEFHNSRNGSASSLVVSGRVEKIVEIPPPPDPDPGHAEINGSLKDFRIELLNMVEVVFKEFAFKSETDEKLDVTVVLDEGEPVRFKRDLQFLEELRKTIPPDLFGEGPSLDINATRVKAGFSIALPPASVGVFSLRDVTLGAFLELPFLDGKPVFDFSFSSRERPFNLTVSFLGGGGFFHLQLDTEGLKMLEAALEFGASASIDLGVASGSVYMMAGIYFSVQRRTIDNQEVDAATLAGYFRMGGEVSVLGFISISIEFYLCFAYEFEKNAAYGQAILTIEVDVLFISVSVDITIEKRFGGTGGDPLFLETFNTPAVWDEYAGAFA